MNTNSAPHRPGSNQTASSDLSDEIHALRAMMAQLVEASQTGDPGFKDLAYLVDKYSQASTRVARLIRSQRDLAGDNDLGEALTQVIAEVLASRPDDSR